MNERYARRLERAVELMDEGDVDEALELAQQVYRKYPRDAYAQMVYGAALWEVEEEWRGLELLERGLKKAPERVFLRNLFAIYLSEDLPSYALELASWGAVRGIEVDAEGLAEVRGVVESYGQPLEAVKAFDLLKWRLTRGEEVPLKAWQQLVARYPDFVEAHNNLAVTALYWGELDTAREVSEAVLRRDPSNWFAKGLSWQLQWLIEGPEVASEVDRAWFEAAIESPQRQVYLITTALTVGAYDEALRLAERLSEGMEEQYALPQELRIALCHAALNLGRHELAQRYAQRLPLPEGEPPFPTVPLRALLPPMLYPDKPEALRSYVARYAQVRTLLWAWLPFMLSNEARQVAALLQEEGALDRFRAVLRDARGSDRGRVGVLMQLVKSGALSLPTEVRYGGELRELPRFAVPGVAEEIPLGLKQRRNVEKARAAPKDDPERYVRGLLRKDPHNPLLELQLARQLARDPQGRDEARERLEKLLEAQPRLLAARAQLAHLALDRYAFDEAFSHIAALRQEPTWPERDYVALLEVQLRYALETGFSEEMRLFGDALRSVAEDMEMMMMTLLPMIELATEEMRRSWRAKPLPRGEALRAWLARYPEEYLATIAESSFDAQVEDLPELLVDAERLHEVLGELPPHARALLDALVRGGGRIERSSLPAHVPSAINALEHRLLVWVTPDEVVIPPPILGALRALGV